MNNGTRLYSPRIDSNLIPALYRIRERCRKEGMRIPMTQLVNTAIWVFVQRTTASGSDERKLYDSNGPVRSA